MGQQNLYEKVEKIIHMYTSWDAQTRVCVCVYKYNMQTHTHTWFYIQMKIKKE